MGKNWRQKLHLEPPQGWLNDPNGLCFYQGNYHVYFQYAPDSAEGKGKKCWGHYQSPDLLDWEFTGTVLRPDIAEDRDGVYSGSAFEKDGVLHLFYTGNVKEPGDHDYILTGRGANVIRVSTADGRTMSEKTVVLRNQDYPAFCSCHVRDPKLRQADGKYYMVLGARTRDDKGCVLTYVSADLKAWQYDGQFSLPDFGYMWECPDRFDLDDREYLGISPQGLESQEFCRQNVYQAGYLYQNEFYEWDYGFDFYAPQTFDAPGGRKILIGWMGLPDIDYQNPTTELGWQHCLTVPRVLTVLADGRLAQYPVKELERLRQEAKTLAGGAETEMALPFDFEAEVTGDFSLTLERQLTLEYAAGIFQLRFDDRILGGGRGTRRLKLESCRKIRILADTSSLEIYLNDGEAVLSTRFYPQTEKISFGLTGLSGIVYQMKGLTGLPAGESELIKERRGNDDN